MHFQLDSVFLLKILFELLSSGKCVCTYKKKNILPPILLTFQKIWKIKKLYDFLFMCFFVLFFVLVLVAFEINAMLSWKMLFLSASDYIGIESTENNFTRGYIRNLDKFIL